MTNNMKTEHLIAEIIALFEGRVYSPWNATIPEWHRWAEHECTEAQATRHAAVIRSVLA